MFFDPFFGNELAFECSLNLCFRSEAQEEDLDVEIELALAGDVMHVCDGANLLTSKAKVYLDNNTEEEEEDLCRFG